MTAAGSLFLRHVQWEGKILYEQPNCRGWLSTLLREIRPYRNVGRDLVGHRTVIGDVLESLRLNGSIRYELSVLATVLRHAAILGCYPEPGAACALAPITIRQLCRQSSRDGGRRSAARRPTPRAPPTPDHGRLRPPCRQTPRRDEKVGAIILQAMNMRRPAAAATPTANSGP